jgi:hypothetical protein
MGLHKLTPRLGSRLTERPFGLGKTALGGRMSQLRHISVVWNRLGQTAFRTMKPFVLFWGMLGKSGLEIMPWHWINALLRDFSFDSMFLFLPACPCIVCLILPCCWDALAVTLQMDFVLIRQSWFYSADPKKIVLVLWTRLIPHII